MARPAPRAQRSGAGSGADTPAGRAHRNTRLQTGAPVGVSALGEGGNGG